MTSPSPPALLSEVTSSSNHSIADPSPSPSNSIASSSSSSSSTNSSNSSSTPAASPTQPKRISSSVGSNPASAWTAHVDKTTGQTYYANQSTGESSWVKPADYQSPVPVEEDVQGSDWAKILDASSGKFYYANRKTMATSWTVPTEIQKSVRLSIPTGPGRESGASTPTHGSNKDKDSPLPSPGGGGGGGSGSFSAASAPSSNPHTHSHSASTSTPIPVSIPCPSPSPSPEPLIPPPADYERILDPSSQRYYYVHIPTRSVSWQSPEAFRAFEEQEKRLYGKGPGASAALPLPGPPPITHQQQPSTPVTASSPSVSSSTPVQQPPTLTSYGSSGASSSGLDLMSPTGAKKGAKPPPVPANFQHSTSKTPNNNMAAPSTPGQSTASLSASGTSTPSTPALTSKSSFGEDEKDKDKEKDKEVYVDDEEARKAALALGGGNVQYDQRGNPILPAGLKGEITKFQLTGFASEHFRVFKKKTGLMSSRKITVAEILSWQKNCIEKSLLASAKKYSSQAVNAFSLIQNFMGDVPSKKTPAAIAKEIIALAISKPPLRDEIYSQLCKQTKNNPDFKSTVAGWKLLGFCVANFAPTRGFQEYLLKYFVDNYVQRGEILILAPWCYWRLLKTLKEGPVPEGSFQLSQVDDFAKGGVPSWFVTFEGSLEYIIQLQEREGLSPKVPEIMIRLCTFIKSNSGFQCKGIFRIAAQKEHVQELKSHIEKGNWDYLATASNKIDPHTAADVLKIWLRNLYETVFTEDLYEKCLLASDSASKSVEVTRELPRAHYDTLDYLLSFLVELSSHSSTNLMNEENLAIVFCQDLLREPSIIIKEGKEKGDGAPNGGAAKSPANLSMALMNSNKEKNFVKHLLEQWKKGNKGPGPKQPPKEKEKEKETKKKEDTKKK